MTFEMRGRLKDHVDLSDKEFRDALVDAEVRRGIPVQIREIREARGWSQADLGQRIGMPQNNISRMENTRETYLSIPTLLKLAAAFDVALLVKFVPYSELLRWVDNHSLATVTAKSYAEEIAGEELETPPEIAADDLSNVASIEQYVSKTLSGHLAQRHAPQRAPRPGLLKRKGGGLNGIAGDSQGGQSSLHSYGTDEPKAQGS